MSNKLTGAWGMLILAGLASGCATPTYAPPEGPRAMETCPMGRVWVCQDRYPSRLEREADPMTCMCQVLQHVR
ncbi:MAG TPA: hypothetical protein VE175_03420 [Woeseiaceae bacterium]|nr:hypothetical protein [Woeseiaceae bacterium]